MNKDNSTEVSFTGILPVNKEFIVITSSIDDFDDYAPFTRSFQYFATPGDEEWCFNDYKWRTVATCLAKPPEGNKYICNISEKGSLAFAGFEDYFFENIHEKYVSRFHGSGYMSDIYQIGEHLYACGACGQVYKRLGKDHWMHMDEALFQEEGVTLPSEDIHWLSCIRGLQEDEIYVAGGNGLICFWNGSVWRKIECPESSNLNMIYIESSDKVWICGQKGTLLRGNARDGFVNVCPPTDPAPLFTSITRLGDLIYLSCNYGLYTFNEKTRRLQRVKTPELNPPHTESSHVGVADGVLWSVGEKDIVWFDGKTWHRVQHPDNPPYGS